MGMFEPDQSVYADRDTLKEPYVPEEIVGRDDELEEYQAALQPVINGEHPDNIFVYGKSGVGKTASTKYLLGELEQSAEEYDVPVSIVYNRCRGQNTSYQAAISIINSLRDNPISESGHPENKVYRHFWDELLTLNSTVLIVLDEVDYIKDDTLLYKLTRHNDEHDTDLKLGVIGISNETDYRERLTSQVRSSLTEKSISFPPYDANELYEVLTHRANLAFHDGALADGVVRLCAAYGASDGGDARHAIDLLLGAGDLARNEKSDQVTENHVERAREKIEEDERMTVMESFSDHEKLTLYALATFEAKGDTPIRSRNLYDRYIQLCQLSAHEPRTARRVRDYLNDFATLNISDFEQVSEGDGLYKRHYLTTNISHVLEAISSVINHIGVHKSVNEYVSDDLNDTVTTDPNQQKLPPTDE